MELTEPIDGGVHAEASGLSGGSTRSGLSGGRLAQVWEPLSERRRAFF